MEVWSWIYKLIVILSIIFHDNKTGILSWFDSKMSRFVVEKIKNAKSEWPLKELGFLGFLLLKLIKQETAQNYPWSVSQFSCSIVLDKESCLGYE